MEKAFQLKIKFNIAFIELTWPFVKRGVTEPRMNLGLFETHYYFSEPGLIYTMAHSKAVD